jgi:hypothetical protein
LKNLESASKDREVLAFFRDLDIEPSEAKFLFDMLASRPNKAHHEHLQQTFATFDKSLSFSKPKLGDDKSGAFPWCPAVRY